MEPRMYSLNLYFCSFNFGTLQVSLILVKVLIFCLIVVKNFFKLFFIKITEKKKEPKIHSEIYYRTCFPLNPNVFMTS